MKLTTKYLKRVVNEEGNVEITFSLPNYQAKWLDELDKTKTYELEIKEYKDSRTKKQNRYMWALIGEIDKQMNGGRRSKEGDNEIYCDALESANIKYEVKPIEISVYDIVKQAEGVRGIRILQRRNVNDIEFYICKIYMGSSKYTTKEMYDLNEYIKDLASECGIDIRKYEEFRGDE